MGLGPASFARAAASSAGGSAGRRGRPGDALVRQLAHPTGWVGRLLGRVMNRRNRRLIEACVEAISPEVGTAVADVGFGGGAGLGLLMERVGLTGVVTGVDPSAEARDQAARRFADELDLDRLRIVAGSADALPLETASQSGVITVNTVYFWPDLDRGLRELRRILAPGAPLAIGIGAVSVQRRMDFDSRAQRVIDAGALAGAMSGAGLTRISTATPRGDDGPAVVRGHAPG